MDNEFDNIISLGYRCETAFAFTVFLGNVEANMFNWVYIGKLEGLIKFLENPDLFSLNSLEYIRTFGKRALIDFVDLKFDFMYHSNVLISEIVSKDKNYVESKIQETKKDVISKMSHLKDKFFKSLNSSDRNLFVCAYNQWWGVENFEKNIIKLSALIKNLSKNKDSKILLVIDKKIWKTIDNFPVLDNVIYFKFKKYAPTNYTWKIPYREWKKIFKKYKIKKYVITDSSIKKNLEEYKKYWGIYDYPFYKKLLSFENQKYRLVFYLLGIKISFNKLNFLKHRFLKKLKLTFRLLFEL